MFQVNEDLSIYCTRGDAVLFKTDAKLEGEPYLFKAGDLVRFKIFEKKNVENVLLSKDFPVNEDTEEVEIYLSKEETRIGTLISKPKDYWYEIELNPFTDPHTLVGYDEEGAKVFKLFPEGANVEAYDPPTPEDIPFIDDELDMTSTRPVQNQAIARAVASMRSDVKKNTKSASDLSNELAVERARINNLATLAAGSTTGDAELIDGRVDHTGKTWANIGEHIRGVSGQLAEAQKSIEESGRSSLYVRNVKVFSSVHNHVIITSIRNNHDGETGFAVYSSDESGNVGELLLNAKDLTTQQSYAGSFRDGSGYISLDFDCTELSEGDVINGYGLKYLVAQHCMYPYIFIPRSNKPLITWIDDDTVFSAANDKGITVAKALADELGIKCTFACITKKIDSESGSYNANVLSALRNYQSEGFHVVSHSVTHDEAWKTSNKDYSVNRIETEIVDSVRVLQKCGFIESDYIVTPWGLHSETIQSVARKWTKALFNTTAESNHLYGSGRYNINRVFISNTENPDLSYYTHLIDMAYENGDWLVFGTHSGMDEWNTALVKSVFQYALSKGIKVATVSEAFKIRKPLYDLKDMLEC